MVVDLARIADVATVAATADAEFELAPLEGFEEVPAALERVSWADNDELIGIERVAEAGRELEIVRRFGATRAIVAKPKHFGRVQESPQQCGLGLDVEIADIEGRQSGKRPRFGVYHAPWSGCAALSS